MNPFLTKQQKLMHSLNIKVYLLLLSLCLMLLGGISSAHANAGFKIPQQIVSGFVLGRGIIPVDPDTGEGVYLVEFTESGEEVDVIATLNEGMGDTRLMGAAEYNQVLQGLQAYLDSNKGGIARGARVITADAFESGSFPEGAVTLGGAPITNSSLASCGYPDAKSVLVKEKRQRFLPLACDLILRAMSIDASSQQTPLPGNILSLWMDEQGRIKQSSAYRIGFRHGFYGQNGEPETTAPSSLVNFVNPAEHEFYAPVVGAPIRVGISLSGFDLAIASAGENGRYAGSYPTVPCPGSFYSKQNQLTVEIKYLNLLPTGSPVHPFYMPRITYDSCSNYAAAACGAVGSLGAASACSNAIGAEATASIPVTKVSFLFDVMQFQGFALIANNKGIVSIDEETTWHEPSGELAKRTQNLYDLDGDGQFDASFPGIMQPLKAVYPEVSHENPNQLIFTPVAELEEATHQGILLSSQEFPTDGQPHVVKLIDQKNTAELDSIGLVNTLSEADYANTDIYIFRESTGELVLQRHGVRDDEYRQTNTNANEVDSSRGVDTFGYRIKLRGNQDSRHNVGNNSRFDEKNTLGPAQEYASWAARSQLEPKFQVRSADLLSPGEEVRIIAINRSTGYIGTQRQVIYPGSAALNNIVNTIVMGPPNLRVWAEREYRVEKGITEGEEREYLIGQEGGATTSDSQIVIYTEWLDHDGSPLPSELGRNTGKDLGLTGSLQKIIGPNKLGKPGGSIHRFGIKPGLQTQVITLPNDVTDAGHFYVHVIGEPINEDCQTCADFETTHPNPVYAGRPRYSVPFYVPVANEDVHQFELYTFNQARDKLIELGNDAELANLIKPKSFHDWVQRPEYAFSVLDFDVQQIRREFEDEQGNQQVVNIADQDAPVINTGDDLLEVLYSINAGQNDPLAPFDSAASIDDRFQLVFGEDEAQVTFGGGNQSIEFDNIDHLGQISVDDLLTISLVSNNDAQNILWEWAFETLHLDTGYAGYDASNSDVLYVSADDVEVPLQSILLGYAARDLQKKDPVRLKWSLSGAGQLERTQDISEDLGVFYNTLTMPRVAGSKAKVRATLLGGGSNPDTYAEINDIEVIPGKPGRMDVQAATNISAGGIDKVRIDVDVWDGYFNRCLLYTSPSPRDGLLSRMPSSA